VEFLKTVIMKAKESLTSEQYLRVDAVAEDGSQVEDLLGSQISPRGVCAVCSDVHIAQLYSKDHTDDQPRFQTLLLTLELGFPDGEMVQLETAAKVQSIRRVSQQEFEVFMGFSSMVQDGYRHISRYIGDSKDDSTE
jgi:hypothetical protein